MWDASQYPDWVWHLAEALGAIGSVSAAIIAWYQIGELRREQRGWKSLEACNRYEMDEVLDQALRALRDARRKGGFTRNLRSLRLEATVVLNYLDGVAIGLKQGFYDERIVRAHLENIMRGHVEELLSDEVKRKMDYSEADWATLIALLQEWDARPGSLWGALMEIST